jgi:hypothetical protein
LGETDINAVDNLTFNIQFYNDGEEIIKLYVKDVGLEKGELLSRTGTNAFVKYSTKYYDKMCIKFESDTPNNWQLKSKKICNEINEYEAESTQFEEYEEEEEGEEEGLEENEGL